MGLDDILNKITNGSEEENNIVINEEKKLTNKKFSSNINIPEFKHDVTIKVFGVGGAGCNIIDAFYINNPFNLNLYAFNTDINSLRIIQDKANVHLLAQQLLLGRGSGGDPHIGKIAANEDKDTIMEMLKDCDILFLIAGLGKGTGSGSGPEIAKIAKSLGITIISFVNMPSLFSEGKEIFSNAFISYGQFKEYSTSIFVTYNEKIITRNSENYTFLNAYDKANKYIVDVINSIVEIIQMPSKINIDYADLKNFFTNNKLFFSDKIYLPSPYVQEEIERSIETCFNNSYAKMFFSRTLNNNLILNFNINGEIPSNFINDIVKAFNRITKVEIKKTIYGVNESKKGNYFNFLLTIDDKEEENELKNDTNNFASIFKEDNKTEKIDNIFSTNISTKKMIFDEDIFSFKNKTNDK
jgi:cell division protein FtsZ